MARVLLRRRGRSREGRPVGLNWNKFRGLGNTIPTLDEVAELTARVWVGPMYERLDALLVTSALSVGRRTSSELLPDPEYDRRDATDRRPRLVAWPISKTGPVVVEDQPVEPVLEPVRADSLRLVPTTRTWVIVGNAWVLR